VEALGQLCGPRWGHEFTLVADDKIIRYGLSGQEVSATEDSDSSSDSSDEEAELPVGPRPGFLNDPVPMVGAVEAAPRPWFLNDPVPMEPFPDSAEGASSAAGGGHGTKRPASDPHSVKGEILRLMQGMSKEDRIALLKELKDEECPVCQERYNHPDDLEKDPVVGECGHTMCKTCEPEIRDSKCPKCRRLWKRASIELLFV